MAYCRKAIISPTCSVDAATWCAPTQMMSTDKSVHQQHHQGHHHHHNAVDKQAVAGEVLVGFIKALKFKFLGIESADDHDAGKSFTGHQVEAVDQALDALEARQGDDEYGDDQSQQNPTPRPDDPGHGRTFVNGADDGADGNDGRVEDHADEHHQRHLQLGDVIGGARDQ